MSILKKGEIVIVTSGGYSDYQIHYVAEVKIEFDTTEVSTEYLFKKKLSKIEHERPNWYDRKHEFFVYLQLEGYLKPIISKELRINDYATEPDGFVDVEEYTG